MLTRRVGITTTPRLPRGRPNLGLHQLGKDTAHPQVMDIQVLGLQVAGRGLQGMLGLIGRHHQHHGALVALCRLRELLPARQHGLSHRRPDIWQGLHRVIDRRGMLTGGLICLHRPGMAPRHLMGRHPVALPQAGQKARANVTEHP